MLYSKISKSLFVFKLESTMVNCRNCAAGGQREVQLTALNNCLLYFVMNLYQAVIIYLDLFGSCTFVEHQFDRTVQTMHNM